MILHVVAYSTPIALDYGKAPGIRRRHVLLAILAAIIIVIATLTYFFGRSTWQQFQSWQLRRQLMAWSEPPDRVVYEPDESRWSALQGMPNYERAWGPKPHFARRVPAWDEYRPTPNKTVPLFLHSRAAPGEESQLVSVYLADSVNQARAWQPRENFVGLKMNLQYEVDGAAGVARVLLPVPGWNFDKPRYTRFFAGQADPDDPAHFTIAYEIGQHRGTIDCRMIGGNMIAFSVQDATTAPATAPAASARR